MVIKLEEDDHGHATLLVHGEPEIIKQLAAAVTLLLAADAEEIIIPDAESVEEAEEDLASSS